ncbi:MAG: TIGR00341 family protein [bacterium]|nr:TIGR00341 family protein [bacterium]
MPKTKKKGEKLEIKAVPTREEQYHTVDEIIEKSKPSFVYYFLLSISALIITGGLLLSNSAIVIGGMMVAPVLSPIIAMALAITVGRKELLRHEAWYLLKSFVFLILAGFLLTIIFQGPPRDIFFESTMRAAVLYFIVAFCAGAAGTFAFAHKKTSDILPGIAVAVSLVPPLVLIGISLAALNFELTRFSFLVFILNTIGIIFGGIITFSFMKFHRAEKRVDEEIKLLEAEEKERAKGKVQKAKK